MKVEIVTPLLFGLLVTAGAAVAVQPTVNTQLYYDLNNLIAKDPNVKAIISDYRLEEDMRFQEHLEIVRIASPSRQEYYRAKVLAQRLKAAGFADEEIVFTGDTKTFPGSAVQKVDGLPVYMTCGIVKGIWDHPTDGSYTAIDPLAPSAPPKPVYARPKVVIEGHIDTVNPAEIPDFDPVAKPNPWYFEPVKLQPVWENGAMVPVVSTKEELAAIPFEMSFFGNGLVNANDPTYKVAIKRYTDMSTPSNWTEVQKGAYRIYVPGYSDAMGNTIGVYHMAKLFKKYEKSNGMKPVHDIWFCFTAGEEGRGNLAGMKQLYGYNQQNPNPVPGEPGANGKNRLNIVANLSIDGGTMTINYLGSYRYEINYKGENGALEAARSIAAIADVRSPTEPSEQASSGFTDDDNTTYTVGIAYQKDDGSTSFEIDMRAPTAPPLDEMKSRLYPKFRVGENVNGVKVAELWYGDRPPHKRAESVMLADPMIYAAWQTYIDVGLGSDTFQLPTKPTSLNDNIPGAMDVPTLNMNLAATATGGGNHAFNEWGIRGTLDQEMKQMERVLYTLLAVAGLADGNSKTIKVPAAYSDFAPRHTNERWDPENYWQNH